MRLQCRKLLNGIFFFMFVTSTLIFFAVWIYFGGAPTDNDWEEVIDDETGQEEYTSVVPSSPIVSLVQNKSVVQDKSSSPIVVPISKPKYCVKPHCNELLSENDKKRQTKCLLEVAKHRPHSHPFDVLSEIKGNDCNFMDGTGRYPVALASAEGSGNTWVRGLLEKASGICTGFNFCDYVMRSKGFIGDNINSGSVLVVKTHAVQPQWIGTTIKISRHEARYGSAIFILRNPHNSLIAEWNRRLTNMVLARKRLPHNESHVNVAPKEIWCESI